MRANAVGSFSVWVLLQFDTAGDPALSGDIGSWRDLGTQAEIRERAAGCLVPGLVQGVMKDDG
jgi:hypothetical protein